MREEETCAEPFWPCSSRSRPCSRQHRSQPATRPRQSPAAVGIPSPRDRLAPVPNCGQSPAPVRITSPACKETQCAKPYSDCSSRSRLCSRQHRSPAPTRPIPSPAAVARPSPRDRPVPAACKSQSPAPVRITSPACKEMQCAQPYSDCSWRWRLCSRQHRSRLTAARPPSCKGATPVRGCFRPGSLTTGFREASCVAAAFPREWRPTDCGPVRTRAPLPTLLRSRPGRLARGS